MGIDRVSSLEGKENSIAWSSNGLEVVV